MTFNRPPEPSAEHPQSELRRVARFPGLRALAWCGNHLYASRGYDLLRTTIQPGQAEPVWQIAANFQPARWRRFSSSSRLSARLFRDGFHALAVLDSGAMVAAVAGAMVALAPNEREFRATHVIQRGTRPLHITAVPEGPILWGEYFDNPSRAEVHIYASPDAGIHWEVAYTFPRGAIRHVHNVVYDSWGNCLWILTGDYEDECRILRASCDLSQIDVVLQGNQQARAAALIPAPEGIYFSSDAPLEQNFIFRADRGGNLSKMAPINAPSIYGCRAAGGLFFSTMVEPGVGNIEREVRIYGSADGNTWNPLLAWKKDRWPMRLFQYGNAFLPDGNNTGGMLAVSTVAVEADEMTLSMYSMSHYE
jgi:hypothetical protein